MERKRNSLYKCASEDLFGSQMKMKQNQMLDPDVHIDDKTLK